MSTVESTHPRSINGLGAPPRRKAVVTIRNPLIEADDPFGTVARCRMVAAFLQNAAYLATVNQHHIGDEPFSPEQMRGFSYALETVVETLRTAEEQMAAMRSQVRSLEVAS